MAALFARQTTGKGQYIDISMMDGIVAMLPFPASLLWGMGKVPSKGRYAPRRLHGYQRVWTGDGKYLSLGALEPRFWAELCRKLGREDYIAHQYDEGEKRGEIFSFLARKFKEKTREEWMAGLQDPDVCFGKVLDVDETFDDPQVRHRNLVTDFVNKER